MHELFTALHSLFIATAKDQLIDGPRKYNQRECTWASSKCNFDNSMPSFQLHVPPLVPRRPGADQYILFQTTTSNNQAALLAYTAAVQQRELHHCPKEAPDEARGTNFRER